MTLRIYVACLASYNAGTSHGRWIDACDDSDAMQAEIAAMLRQSPQPGAEEWAIHDYDGAVPPGMGEFTSLATIAAWVGLIAEADQAGLPAAVVAGLASHFGEPHGPEPFAETARAVRENYCGTFDSLADWAEELESETGELGRVPERLPPYIDWQAIGRDACLGGDILGTEDEAGRLAVFWTR